MAVSLVNLGNTTIKGRVSDHWEVFKGLFYELFVDEEEAESHGKIKLTNLWKKGSDESIDEYKGKFIAEKGSKRNVN